MAVKLITPPASEPITLAEAKAHLRVEVSDDDLLIGSLITAAREAAEHETRRALMLQTWELALTEFPGPAGAIRLSKPPMSSIISLQYVDSDGQLQTMAEADFRLSEHTEGADLYPAYSINWPLTRKHPGAVTVRYVAGYPVAASVPAQIKAWMLLRIGALYENRESVINGTTSQDLGSGFVDHMLDAYKVWGY
jgi:uncharacterized phiE125 gp8 family phage protein